MKSRWFCLTATLVLLVASAPQALAQCNPEEAGARAFHRLESAQEPVARSKSEEAQRLLQAAKRRLEEARQYHQERRTALACASIAAANTLIDKAIEVARNNDRAGDRVEQDLSRIRQMLQEIKDQVNECGSEEAKRMLDGAFRQLARAVSSFQNGDLRAAVAFANSAENQGRRARRFCEGDLAMDPETLKLELERTDALIQDVAERIGAASDPDPLGPARELQAQAWEFFRTNRYLASATLTRRARDLARNAARRDAESVPVPEIERLIRSTQDQVDRLEERAEELGHDQAKRLLAQASRLLHQARQQLGAKNPRRALASARTASALAQDVAEMLGESEE